MKKKFMYIISIIMLFVLVISGCEKNTNKNTDITDVYGKKRAEYMDNDDYIKGYKIDSGGTSYTERVTYNAMDGDGVISGYTAYIKLISEENEIKEEDFVKFAEVEFMQYMDSGSWNIVQMSCIVKTPDKKEHTFILRFADEERTRVIQYIKNENGEEYKEVDNSYIEKAGKAGDKRYFYTKIGNNDFLFKDIETGETLSLNVDTAELVFGKHIDAYNACDIIMAKADEHRKEVKEDARDYICNGVAFQIETKGKSSAIIAVIYDENGYKIFKVNDEIKEMKTLEKVEGIYVKRDSLKKELENIL